ncbi:MAG: glycosyltransferase family 2 protein [Candidatus Krumholzibacteriia bacterium]
MTDRKIFEPHPRERPASVELSVVVPCYNEQECLEQMYRRVSRVCAELAVRYELVLVDDGSTDATWSLMSELQARDPAVVAVKLSRNHGHQLALSCGLQLCRGERVFIIDADLQDPPELLAGMMARMDRGVDVVYGKRRHRAGETRFKLVTAKIFYRTLGWLSDVEIPMDVGDFRLVSRRALDALNRMPEQHRFLRGMMSWVGFRQEAFEYERSARFAGQTKYSLRQMTRLAMNAVASFSTRPLALAGVVSALTAGLGVAILLYAAVGYLRGDVISGWTSVIGVVSLLASVQLAYLGVIGFYLGRLYEQTKGRPLFVVEEIREQAAGARPLAWRVDRDGVGVGDGSGADRPDVRRGLTATARDRSPVGRRIRGEA